MEGIVERRCVNCIFFTLSNEYGGYCQRNPKQFYMEQHIEALPEIRFISGWYYPWTQHQEWCGEFKDKWQVRNQKVDP